MYNLVRLLYIKEIKIIIIQTILKNNKIINNKNKMLTQKPSLVPTKLIQNF